MTASNEILFLLPVVLIQSVALLRAEGHMTMSSASGGWQRGNLILSSREWLPKTPR